MFFGLAATLRLYCGEHDMALAHFAELKRRAASRPVSPLVMGFVHAALGHTDRALDALERAFDERNMVLWFISRELTIAPLRAHPRFRKIVSAMGLPETETGARGEANTWSSPAVSKLANS